MIVRCRRRVETDDETVKGPAILRAQVESTAAWTVFVCVCVDVTNQVLGKNFLLFVRRTSFVPFHFCALYDQENMVAQEAIVSVGVTTKAQSRAAEISVDVNPRDGCNEH